RHAGRAGSRLRKCRTAHCRGVGHSARLHAEDTPRQQWKEPGRWGHRGHRQAARDHHRRRDPHGHDDPQHDPHPAGARRQRDLRRVHARAAVGKRRGAVRPERHREAHHDGYRAAAPLRPEHGKDRSSDRGAPLRRGDPPDPRGRVRRRALQPTGVAAAAPGHLAIATRSPVSFIGGLFDSNEGELRKLRKIAARVNQLEPEIQKRSDAELAESTTRFRDRLAKGETLDDILPEVFASVREAAKRNLGQRHFDVQLMGGLALHKGHIAEMRTGEGKTLVASLALYANALEGQGADLITTNDYLAKTGAGWMAPIYRALGATVAYIAHEKSAIYDPAVELEAVDPRHRHWRDVSRREAYEA